MSNDAALPAQRIGKYELERRLGGGGMAEVYLARLHGAEGFSRRVALKRILPGHSHSAQFTQMFVAEARLLAKLHHPNIVAVVDFDLDPHAGHFLVMEWIEGCDLSQLVATGLLPIPVVVYIAIEVLRGLGYAHSLPAAAARRGIVHRDVSPHNVLISWEGVVKVSDFGLAKTLASVGDTSSGVLRGKPAYMSPEQANGQPLDGRSDLFSVGIVLWEMLIGQHLFSAASPQEVVAQVIVSLIPPPRRIRSAIPQRLSDITMRLLERDPASRYPTAAHAIQDLLALLELPHNGREATITVMSDRFSNAAPTIPLAASDSQAAPSIIVLPRIDLASVRRDMRKEMAAPRTHDVNRRRRPWRLLLTVISAFVIAAVTSRFLWKSTQLPTRTTHGNRGIPLNSRCENPGAEPPPASMNRSQSSLANERELLLPPPPPLLRRVEQQPVRSSRRSSELVPSAAADRALGEKTPLSTDMQNTKQVEVAPLSLDQDGDGIPDVR